MENKIEPNSNHFDKESFEEEENGLEVIEEENDEEIEVPDNNQNVRDVKKEYRSRMIKMFGIVIVAFLVIILIGFIISLLNKKSYSYTDVENIMKDAAIEYFKSNKSKLPASESQTVEIHDNTLSANEYMKPLEEYLDTTSCSGKVVVEKTSSSEYSYTPYLDCGEKYLTRELYKEIIDKKNIVTTGYGLYAMHGEYVYRGKDVDNYVKFKNSNYLWRIVKVTNKNEIVLIQNDRSKNTYAWDNRYNSVETDNSGINVYNNSSISEVLKVLYDAKFDGEKYEDDESYYQYNGEHNVLKKIDKSKLKQFDACVGTRSQADTSKNGGSECSVVTKTKVGLLTVSDFLNASIDPGCIETTSPQCQNYNYLTNTYNYWLANGASEKSNKVYRVSPSNYIGIRNADSSIFVRLVIHVGEDAMIESGEGTKESPYIIR